jgi:hypothetical protein
MLNVCMANMNSLSLQNIFIVDNTQNFKFRVSNIVPLNFQDKHMDFMLRRMERAILRTHRSSPIHNSKSTNGRNENFITLKFSEFKNQNTENP